MKRARDSPGVGCSDLLTDSHDEKMACRVICQITSPYRAYSEREVLDVVQKLMHLVSPVIVGRVAGQRNRFVLDFDKQYDVQRSVDDGPWILAPDSYDLLHMRRYGPIERLQDVDMNLCDFWVQMDGLPHNQQTARNAMICGNRDFVRFNNIDERCNTTLRFQVTHAIDRPLPLGFQHNRNGVGKEVVRYLYERIPHICLKCGRIGHPMVACRFNKDPNWAPMGLEYGPQMRARLPMPRNYVERVAKEFISHDHHRQDNMDEYVLMDDSKYLFKTHLSIFGPLGFIARSPVMFSLPCEEHEPSSSLKKQVKKNSRKRVRVEWEFTEGEIELLMKHFKPQALGHENISGENVNSELALVAKLDAPSDLHEGNVRSP